MKKLSALIIFAALCGSASAAVVLVPPADPVPPIVVKPPVVVVPVVGIPNTGKTPSWLWVNCPKETVGNCVGIAHE